MESSTSTTTTTTQQSNTNADEYFSNDNNNNNKPDDLNAKLNSPQMNSNSNELGKLLFFCYRVLNFILIFFSI